jgi:glycosyltransferase involved in cell wall biosynthesis
VKIAILGTKGIPNNYGGFEQFAECISVILARRGHQVTVYNPEFHPFTNTTYEGVAIKKVYCPENWMGPAANFIYDHLCLKDALNSDFDIVYEAGYHSVALSYLYFNIRKIRRPVIVTNMDGLEWLRSKWNPFVKRFIKVLERIAVSQSTNLISDNPGIQSYYKKLFNRDSYYIPYGVDLIENVDENLLSKYGLTAYQYFMIVARLEPENNIETVLAGYVKGGQQTPFIVVGNFGTKYGHYLKSKFSRPWIHFLGGIYERKALDALRYFSKGYFHGHSVGGTNPSLLEAMACRCFIIAHDNVFNRGVLHDGALFFENGDDIDEIVQHIDSHRSKHLEPFIELNLARIHSEFSWEKVATQHEYLFEKLIITSK